MAIMINASSRSAAAAAGRALSLAIRAEALADEIDALHRGIRGLRGQGKDERPPLAPAASEPVHGLLVHRDVGQRAVGPEVEQDSNLLLEEVSASSG